MRPPDAPVYKALLSCCVELMTTTDTVAELGSGCAVFQDLLKQTGGAGKGTVFLITDTQIKEESFLEDIDSLLNTGEVPQLFAADEKGEIMEVRGRLRLMSQRA